MRGCLGLITSLLLLCTGCSFPSDTPVETSGQSSQVNQTAAQQQFVTEMAKPEEPVLPLDGATICIDPGHCITKESGKGRRELVSPLSTETKPLFSTGTSGANMTEEALNLTVGLQLRDALETLGAKVVMTREVSKITITGIERCEIANKSGSEVCVRIHADGAADSSVHGISVLVPTGKLLGTPSIAEESTRLGKLMVNAVAEKTGASNRGTVPRSDLTGFNFSQIPTVLIEMGYMTNPEEDAKLETAAYQKLLVDGMVQSLLDWYGVK